VAPKRQICFFMFASWMEWISLRFYRNVRSRNANGNPQFRSRRSDGWDLRQPPCRRHVVNIHRRAGRVERVESLAMKLVSSPPAHRRCRRWPCRVAGQIDSMARPAGLPRARALEHDDPLGLLGGLARGGERFA
jgi:hypothetical protein